MSRLLEKRAQPHPAMIDGGREGFSALMSVESGVDAAKHGTCVRRKSYPSCKPESMTVSGAMPVEQGHSAIGDRGITAS
jgi:hypothetical protein